MWLATGMTPCPGTSWGRDSVVAELGMPGYGHGCCQSMALKCQSPGVLVRFPKFRECMLVFCQVEVVCLSVLFWSMRAAGIGPFGHRVPAARLFCCRVWLLHERVGAPVRVAVEADHAPVAHGPVVGRGCNVRVAGHTPQPLRCSQ